MRSRFPFTLSVLCTFVLVVCAAVLISVGYVSAQVAPGECRDAAGAPVLCTPTPVADRDGDGVPDALDACPDQPGAPGGNGCPVSTDPTATPLPPVDSDGDGVADANDRCPAQAGTPGLGAGDCPDPDGDSITNDGDRCPDQPGPAETGGCPAAGATALPTLAATPVPQGGPTLDPSTGQANPLQPPADGPCQVASATSVRAIVRATPSMSAAQVASLETNLLYAVLGAYVNDEGTWYRVESGWVNAFAVNVGGDCPARIVYAGPSGFSIPQPSAADGGIFPEEDCFTLFNGVLFCQTMLSATADPNGEGSTEGAVPYDVWQCGFGSGGVICVATTLTYFTEDDPCSIPEFCEPQPAPGGGDPLPFPTLPPPEDDAGQVACEDLILDLTAQAGEEAQLTVFDQQRGASFALYLPDVEPQPCRATVHVVREGTGANGALPIEEIVFDTEFPQPVAFDVLMELDGIPGESADGSRPLVHILDTLRVDADGGVCLTVRQGDFSHCPGEPPLPADRVIAPTATPDIPLPQLLDELLALPENSDPTEYFCNSIGSGVIACVCQGFDDCFDMASNVCAGPDVDMICHGENCVCAFEDTPE